MATGTRPIKGGSAGALIDYLQDKTDTIGYYDDGAGFDLSWCSLAREWGLERDVSREHVERIFDGQDPHTGEQLARARKDRVPFHDMTVSFPKSVAELFVVADEDLRAKLREAALASAKAGAEYLQETGMLSRQTHKVLVGDRYESVQRRSPAELFVLPVLQYSARPTKETEERGAPADPSIHVHMAIASLSRIGEKWYTVDSWGLFKAAQHVDAVVMGEMARQLEDLGIELTYTDIERSKNGKVRWEVAGSARETRDHWSSNRRRMWEISRDYEEKFGKPIDDYELRRQMHLTRQRKDADDKEQDVRPNWELWEQDARDHGVPLMPLHRRWHQRDPYVAVAELQRRLMGPAGLVRDGSVFDEPTVGQTVRRCAVGLGFTPEELAGFERALLNDVELIQVEDGPFPEDRKRTTRTLLDAERRITIARQMKGDRWVDITGPAGTGKSHLTALAMELGRGGNPDLSMLNDGQRAGVSAITYAGPVDQVVCVSMAATTAERTGTKIRADHAGSVESIIARIERGQIRITTNTVVVVEEAGQLDTLRADKLLRAVGSARIVTLGDHRQLSPLSAGGWYQDNIELNGSIELEEVKRQVDRDDVRDYDLVRQGRAAEALGNLSARGRVHSAETNAERMATLLRDYKTHRNLGRSAEDVRIVMDGTNRDVDTANRFAQRDRMARAEISHESVEVVDEIEDRRWELHRGDLGITRQSVRTEGDPIKNGTRVTVTELHPDLGRVGVVLEDGREATVPADAVLPRYAVHLQREQGGEAPIVLYAVGQTVNRESAYTALSRGVEETHIYRSEEMQPTLEGLAQDMSRSEAKESASSLIAKARAAEIVAELPQLDAPDHVLPVEVQRRDMGLHRGINWDAVEAQWEQEQDQDRGLER